ncbi:serine protease gd-like isoform X2 [Toxorhynchites rutilus septentrionalis]|nr:serine protease gd-like isoform X2 [Toxorhynchites rutilus septentrionalis]XP_055641642.1 serine protease gd-like isoform X2 [Toxorhynchites rutilus septentrionalis]XP_055641644.1 serine protease gd-like isoform X2 [Toxorhynchites rutilus septentrionalis]XP_055641645.1 serine protease gd-like isoform X2 [Toxorhynchites rutilus septentrionalis]XP_055641646.1 serine protease gd-like isoform X2 [Toxorhynchites rutilus septentrionalis]XP_055641647.1 serine protease gd-like isoform X2 [Toxorhync
MNSSNHHSSLLIYFYGLVLVLGQIVKAVDMSVPISPCPKIFTYRRDLRTNRLFGRIDIRDLQMGQTAKLNVDLVLGTQLRSDYIISHMSIALVKSLEATFNDIASDLPAQYRVNFPLQSVLPTVRSIALNDQTICSGRHATGRIVHLEKTLYLQPHTPQAILQGRNVRQYQRSVNEIQNSVVPTALNMLAHTHASFLSHFDISSKCGKPSRTFLTRLSVNGAFVNRGQFPWAVPLFDRTQSGNPRYICGSTIITKKHLITAAHCVYDGNDPIEPERILAVPGMFNIDNFFDDNAKFVDIDAIVPHEEYIHGDRLNDADVAVLRMTRELEYSDYIIPICLWQGDNDLTWVVGKEGYVAGWGASGASSSSVTTYLTTTILDKRRCSVNESQPYQASARILCGKGQQQTSCVGDSGSGLVMRRGSQYYLRGVASRGQFDYDTVKCDTTRYAVYIDVAFLRYWLKLATRL